MFTFFDSNPKCSRRDFLTVGSLAGLSLPMLLASKAAGQETRRSLTTGKSVIFLTNDARRSPEDYVQKLWSMGIRASLEEVVTVGASIQHMLAERPRHVLADDPGRRIGRAARRIRHHDGDGAAREGLRVRTCEVECGDND